MKSAESFTQSPLSTKVPSELLLCGPFGAFLREALSAWLKPSGLEHLGPSTRGLCSVITGGRYTGQLMRSDYRGRAPRTDTAGTETVTGTIKKEVQDIHRGAAYF